MAERRSTDPIDGSPNDAIPSTLPSIPVSDEENNDDPPPYAAIAPPNHVRCWPFSAGCSAGLAPFQVPFQPSYQPPPFHSEANGQLGPSSVPLMPYRMLRLGSAIFPQRRDDGFSYDGERGGKGVNVKTRRYGAILVAAAVIVFLMALSLMVRFIVEKSFWRG